MFLMNAILSGVDRMSRLNVLLPAQWRSWLCGQAGRFGRSKILNSPDSSSAERSWIKVGTVASCFAGSKRTTVGDRRVLNSKCPKQELRANLRDSYEGRMT